MASASGGFLTRGFLPLLLWYQMLILLSAVRSEIPDSVSLMMPDTAKSQGIEKDNGHCSDCGNRKENDHWINGLGRRINSYQPNKNIEVTAIYVDASGVVKMHTVNSRDLSASWLWENSDDESYVLPKSGLGQEDISKLPVHVVESEDNDQPYTDQHLQVTQISPKNLKNKSTQQKLRQERKEERVEQWYELDGDDLLLMNNAAIKRSKNFNDTIRKQYSIWNKEHLESHPDNTLKLMRDQIVMAKVYSSIASSKGKLALVYMLIKSIKECQRAIGEAKLQQGALELAKAMGHLLSEAKDELYDCAVVARKLRAMVQSSEEVITAQQKKSIFLTQFGAQSIPKPLHCLPLQLTADHFLHPRPSKRLTNKARLGDPSLYHFVIVSDNVLATSVVVNSTVSNANKPQKHVFHIVTDRLNYAAMRMWFSTLPLPATIHVRNIDEFKWLNSSYCPVLRQAESATLKSFYFAANHPHTVSIGDEHLKYRNPKYLSMLNHLRFYLPEIFPNLDKILFLDDDTVVQQDLTALWNIDMKGMVNGAVETCKGSFHQFQQYLNFSDSRISRNFNPKACGWAFGMNIFDLKEWRKHNITAEYHYWQNLNKDRKLWQLGSLPAGLLAFYKLTYPLNRRWHLLALGYNPSISSKDIQKAAVLHYNGNYKPWLDFAISDYKKHWTKYIDSNHPYFRACNIHL